jgi:hypothetical protein
MYRGDEPERYRNSAVVTPRYKLVDGQELYDLESDPGEQRDLAGDQRDRVTALREAYDEWFDGILSDDRHDPPRIVLGTPHENPQC